MALRTLHLCQFQFQKQDIRVVGSETDGGTSLSGLSDSVQTDGGGHWLGDWSDGNFGGGQTSRRADTLAWRAMGAGLSGGQRVIVRLCDRHHQPVFALSTVPHSDDTPFDDGSEYASGGSTASVLAVVNGDPGGGGLNCTILDIAITSERPLIGGERFTHVHPIWLDRAYEIASVEDIDGGYKRIKFQPPIRGGIEVGDALDFDNVRCVMKRVSQPTNAISMGLYSSASLQMVEDMRPPVA